MRPIVVNILVGFVGITPFVLLVLIISTVAQLSVGVRNLPLMGLTGGLVIVWFAVFVLGGIFKLYE